MKKRESIDKELAEAVARSSEVFRKRSRKIARRVIENLDRAFRLASELSACDGTEFDHEDFVCSMCHAEAAILRGMGWERNYETGEITRRKGKA
jgi:hypothetical protein